MKNLLLLMIMMSVMSFSVYADTPQMNLTLVKVINQLQNIKGLIEEVKNQQEENPRVKVHFDSWVDADGVNHNGLRDDINLIQQALIAVVNNDESGPRRFEPIQKDFIGKDHV